MSNQPAASDDPGEGSFDDPAPGQHGEALTAGILPDDFYEARVLAQGGAQLVAGVGGISPYLDNARAALAQLDYDRRRAIAILDRSRPEANN